MSRSRRKAPIVGVTTAHSEKQDKRDYHRRYRKAVKMTLQSSEEAKPVPVLREYSDPWSMGKDGKRRFDPQKYPDIMRK